MFLYAHQRVRYWTAIDGSDQACPLSVLIVQRNKDGCRRKDHRSTNTIAITDLRMKIILLEILFSFHRNTDQKLVWIKTRFPMIYRCRREYSLIQVFNRNGQCCYRVFKCCLFGRETHYVNMSTVFLRWEKNYRIGPLARSTEWTWLCERVPWEMFLYFHIIGKSNLVFTGNMVWCKD